MAVSMQAFPEWLPIVAVLTLLPGCGSCAGDSSAPAEGTRPTGSISPAGQRFATTALMDDSPPVIPFERDASARDASKPPPDASK
jgi:hypothetical protein